MMTMATKATTTKTLLLTTQLKDTRAESTVREQREIIKVHSRLRRNKWQFAKIINYCRPYLKKTIGITHSLNNGARRGATRRNDFAAV